MHEIDKLDLKADKLVGIEAIAKFRNELPPRTKYLIKKGVIPHYREGRIICASKRALREHHLEAARGGITKAAAAQPAGTEGA